MLYLSKWCSQYSWSHVNGDELIGVESSQTELDHKLLVSSEILNMISADWQYAEKQQKIIGLCHNFNEYPICFQTRFPQMINAQDYVEKCVTFVSAHLFALRPRLHFVKVSRFRLHSLHCFSYLLNVLWTEVYVQTRFALMMIVHLQSPLHLLQKRGHVVYGRDVVKGNRRCI